MPTSGPLEYVVVFACIFGVNLLPAFGPPTWTLLVFFELNAGLSAVPLVLLGAVAAASGRVVLAKGSGRLRGRLSARRLASLAAARQALTGSRRRTAGGLALFALSPLPSAQLFVAVGLLAVPIVPLACAVFAGRLVSYSVYVGGASLAESSLGGALSEVFGSPLGVALQVVMVIGIVALVRLDWAAILARGGRTRTAGDPFVGGRNDGVAERRCEPDAVRGRLCAMTGLRATLRSVPASFRLSRRGRLKRLRSRLGATVVMEDGREFVVFRETVVVADARSPRPAVLVVRFRFPIAPRSPLHAVFRRLCVLTTPFFAGIPGYRIKLWMYNAGENDYQGIYEWESAGQALEYVRSLMRVLRPISLAGSCRYELHDDRSLETYLAARAAEAPSRAPAGRPPPRVAT